MLKERLYITAFGIPDTNLLQCMKFEVVTVVYISCQLILWKFLVLVILNTLKVVSYGVQSLYFLGANLRSFLVSVKSNPTSKIWALFSSPMVQLAAHYQKVILKPISRKHANVKPAFLYCYALFPLFIFNILFYFISLF